MDDFYKEYILDHYRNPRNFGHLEHPTASAEDMNPLCGDKVRVDLQVGDDGWTSWGVGITADCAAYAVTP